MAVLLRYDRYLPATGAMPLFHVGASGIVSDFSSLFNAAGGTSVAFGYLSPSRPSAD